MAGPPKPQALIYGRTTGEVNVPVLVDADGKLEVTTLVTVGAGDASAVNQGLEIAELTELTVQKIDYDTGAGTASQVMFGVALPASGGPIAGGTATNPFRVDPTGTTSQPVKELPDATVTYSPTNATSTAYETSRVLKASAGVLFSLTGYNAKTSAQFIQLHDSASVPADTAVPVITFTISASSNFSLDFSGKFGRYFSTGIVVTNSSTGPTKTIGSADCWFDGQVA